MKKPFVLVDFVASKPVISVMKIVLVLQIVPVVKQRMDHGWFVESMGFVEHLLALKVRKGVDVSRATNVTKVCSARMMDKTLPSVFVRAVLQGISIVAVSPIEVVG